MHKRILVAASAAILAGSTAFAQTKPEETEVWTPVPKVVTPGNSAADAPSDAVILFNGKNLDEWVSVNNPGQPAKWKVADNVMTVEKSTGNIQTKRSFTDYQLHIEYQVPANISGTGQGRGNSGIF